MFHIWDTAQTYQRPSLYARVVQREFPQNDETEVVTCSIQETFLLCWNFGGPPLSTTQANHAFNWSCCLKVVSNYLKKKKNFQPTEKDLYSFSQKMQNG